MTTNNIRGYRRVFDRYPWSGRIPLIIQLPGEENEDIRRGSLTDYARPISIACGYICAYCNRDMAGSLGDFLSGHLEHVVPRYSKKAMGFDRRWIENDCNLVLACSACNMAIIDPLEIRQYLESVEVPDFPYVFLEEHIDDPEYLLRSGRFEHFMRVRDRVYDLKKAHIQRRRLEKYHEFESLKAGQSSGKETLDRKWRIARRSRYRCAYCGRLFSDNLDDWLLVDLEHVVPRDSIKKRSYPSELVEDENFHRVTCHTCNTFANDYRINEVLSKFETPTNTRQFNIIFNAVFNKKFEIVNEKLREYTQFFNNKVRRNR